jgi:diguanylate cyclase (GGDEF)-like protein/PAS domain S-box-containing protein
MRWQNLPLHLQVALASSVILLVTLLLTTSWSVREQRKQLLENNTRQAFGLARTAALASRYLVIADKLDELEELMLRLAHYPDLLELTVLDNDGRVLTDIHVVNHESTVSYDYTRDSLPKKLMSNPRPTEKVSGSVLTIWYPMETSSLLGWIKLELDLTGAGALEKKIVIDNFKASGIALLIDLIVLLAILYLPGKTFRRAVNFAQNLVESPGLTMQQKGASREVTQLIDALNNSSTRLLQQRNTLSQQQGKLEQLNAELEQRVEKRTRALEQSRETQELLHQAITQSRVGVAMLDTNFTVIECNPALLSMTGFSADDLTGQDGLVRIWSRKNPPRLLLDIKNILQNEKSWNGEVLANNLLDEQFWVQLGITPVKNAAGETHYLVSLDDISDRKAYEQELIHQANYDSLTGLPNRVLGMDRLKHSLHQDRRKKLKTVVLYIDLDRFKQINDTLGHHIGDLLLIETAGRLTACVRDYDTVSRLSGDEFMVILSSVQDPVTVETIAEKILDSIACRFKFEDKELHIRASIGIAVYPDDSSEASELLQYADTAMYQAKQLGRNRFKYYTQSMNEEAQQRLKIDSAMHSALQNQELEMVLQPIVRGENAALAGAEALMRWNSATLGVVRPDVFIPIAEENGQIIQMGAWILFQACRAAVKMEGDFFITVNVATEQFRNTGFVQSVQDALSDSGLPPSRLHLEITERVLMEEVDEIDDAIREITRLGVVLVIDDFGTGYSSLSYLTRFPCSALKIDRSFVADMMQQPESASLIEAIIQMGHSLKLKIIAEGVEDSAQLQKIQHLGCDYVQGYFFSRPLSVSGFSEWVSALPADATSY